MVKKDEAEVQEAVAVQEAEDSEPEGSEVSYGSDEPHESYQSDAESDQGKIIPLDLSLLILKQFMAVAEQGCSPVWHCLSKHLPNVEARLDCSQAFLNLNFHCRMSVFELI